MDGKSPPLPKSLMTLMTLDIHDTYKKIHAYTLAIQ